MNKSIGIIIAITILILCGGAYLLTRPEKQINIPPREAGVYEYFWGNGCPHCANVQDFYDTWNKKDSINIKKYEVWYDKVNAKIMEDRFSKCAPQTDKSKMVVPLLVKPDGSCLTGDTQIIDFYKSL